MTRYVALLRGVNIGSRRLAMADLRRVVEDAGGDDVATYIQSGNVVLSHRLRSAARLEAELETAIAESTGMDVPVVARTAARWSSIVEANPFPSAGGKQLHVVFLKDPARATAFEAIDLDALAPEELVVAGRELFLHLPNGMGRAKLPMEIERRGPRDAVGTARNWTTVTRLQEMLTG